MHRHPDALFVIVEDPSGDRTNPHEGPSGRAGYLANPGGDLYGRCGHPANPGVNPGGRVECHGSLAGCHDDKGMGELRW